MLYSRTSRTKRMEIIDTYVVDVDHQPTENVMENTGGALQKERTEYSIQYIHRSMMMV